MLWIQRRLGEPPLNHHWHGVVIISNPGKWNAIIHSCRNVKYTISVKDFQISVIHTCCTAWCQVSKHAQGWSGSESRYHTPGDPSEDTRPSKSGNSLNHYTLVTPYDVAYLDDQWFGKWLFLDHADLSSIKSLQDHITVGFYENSPTTYNKKVLAFYASKLR